MKALRHSFKGNKESHISGPLPLISKPSPALQPPQKVIRATSAYRSQAPQELSFQKGDFFYILANANDQGAWYEAHNPVSGARGLVPKAMFEEFQKSSAKLLQITPPSPQTGQVAINGMKTPKTPNNPTSPTHKAPVFYAVVIHDFAAERADELDAKAGDPISVVAQSNREWFVAKPIGRLGRPGLIPVAFVEVRDPATNQAIEDVGALIDRGDLPRVEDWKRQMLTYKANSIALGVLDDASLRGPVPNSPFMPQYPPTPELPEPENGNWDQNDRAPSRSPTLSILPEGVLLAADVTSFHQEMDEFWFRINAIYQPFEPPGSKSLPPGKQLVLFRSYNDFFDFQVQLLETFPREAGREPPHKRILPYMPGPADKVDNNVTAQRRIELDTYLHNLCELLQTNAQHILQHRVLRVFLSVKPGDVENAIDPQEADVKAMRDLFDYAEEQRGQDDVDTIDDGAYDAEVGMGRMKIDEEEEDEDEGSEGSVYEDETRVQGQAHDRNQPQAYDTQSPARPPRGASVGLDQNRSRSGSSASLQSPRTDSAYHSRSNSPIHQTSNNGTNYYQTSLRNAGQAVSSQDAGRTSEYSQGSHFSVASTRWHENNGPVSNSVSSSTSPTSVRSSTRSRSHSTANSPPISASNQQPAFVKIKIFDRMTDDLIAIRVHPRVSYSQLLDKVQGRLGPTVGALRYRDSMSNEFVGFAKDEDLKEWIQTADKYVLYAE